MRIHIVLLAVLTGACASNSIPAEPKTPVERQMLGLLQKFDLWDEDGSGELDEAEIAKGIKDKGTGYRADQIMDFYDTNGNGGISLREAQTGFKRIDQVGIYTRQ